MIITRRLAAPSALVMCILIAATAAGDSTKAAFPKGTFTLQAYGTEGGGLDADANLASGTVGCGYFVFDNLSLGLEANGYHEHVGGQNASGYGVSGVLRHHLLSFQKSTLFADASFGPIESTTAIPLGGTDFNFITRTGIGITHQLDDHLHLMSGIRYLHLSNARIDGAQRNPSLNGVEGYIGLMWTR